MALESRRRSMIKENEVCTSKKEILKDTIINKGHNCKLSGKLNHS